MRKRDVKLLLGTAVLGFALGASFGAAAHANDYLTGSIGYFDIVRGDYNSTQFGLEYRANAMQYYIHPIVGGSINTDGGAYGYAGINLEVPILANQLYLIPNFAVGAYTEGSDSKDLGGTLEFRSGIEIDYQMENFQRIGVGFNHLSNAGIYNHNPGTEVAFVNYSIPFGTIFGK